MTATADVLTRAMGERTKHQAARAWGINWGTLDRYLAGKTIPNESMIRALVWNKEIDEAELRAAVVADLNEAAA